VASTADSRAADRRIRLVGGPFDGQTVPPYACPSSSLLLEGEPVPEGQVARYRRTRDRDVYRFSEFDRVVLRVPTGEGDE
jgi:hypothetical protein